MRRLRLLGRKPLDILVMGDDDLLSLALILSEARRRVAILDVDPDVLEMIADGAKAQSVDLFLHDLQFGIPTALRNSFDEVFIDPPYTIAGQLLFVHRALCALKARSPAGLYLSSSPVYINAQQLSVLESFLARAGFGLTAQYDSFNCYRAPADVRADLKKQGWRCANWLHSDLFHYTRQRYASVPSIPPEEMKSIYDYSNSEIT